MAATALNEAKRKTNKPQNFSVRGVPIIVYQMGKVGSSTILGGLRKRKLDRSVHHIHVLSDDKINQSIEAISGSGRRFPEQLQHSKEIRGYLDRTQDSPIDVITAVREPVSQLMSSLFQNIHEQQPHLIDDDGQWLEMEIEQFVRERIEGYSPQREWNCNWFDVDFCPALGIDVYESSFDQANGFATIEKDDCRILMLQLENSDEWASRITQFLGLESPLELVNLNVATGKDYKATYQAIKKRIKFPIALLDKIYGTTFCQHFYSPEMISEFKQRWCCE